MASAKLKLSTIAAYAAPAIPISGLGLPLVVYLPPFYVNELGLSATAVGLAFMAGRIWDIATDPLFGYVSDRFDMPWGRRRTWMAMAMPFVLAAVWFLFLPPEGVTPLYLIVTLLLGYAGFTLTTISHLSWGAELSPDYHERARIQGVRELALVFGMLVVLALPSLYELAADGRPTGRDKIAAMGWFIMGLIPLTFGLALWRVPDRAPVRTRHLDWKGAIAVILRNRPLRRLLAADLLQGIAPGVTGTLYIFLVSHAFALPQWANLLLLVYFVSGLAGVPFWIWLSRRANKHRALAYALAYAAATLPALFFLPAGSFWLVFLANMFYGFAYGAGPFLLRAVLADVNDADTVESGSERTGVFYALLALTNKFGLVLALGITYPLLDMIGFDARGTNGEDTLTMLRAIYVVFPVLCLAGGAALMWNFPLDEARQLELRDRLAEARRARGRAQ